MRETATPAEAVLWRAIRSTALQGHKARRQVPLGPFIVDFVIVAARLVIEVDGETHADPAYDQRRTAWLVAQGWQVIRFTNAEVLHNLRGVLTHLLRVLNPHPDPFPTGKGADKPPPVGRGWGECPPSASSPDQ